MVEVTEDFKNHLDGMEPDATLTVIVMAKQHPDLEGLLQGVGTAERRRIMVKKIPRPCSPSPITLMCRGSRIGRCTTFGPLLQTSRPTKSMVSPERTPCSASRGTNP